MPVIVPFQPSIPNYRFGTTLGNVQYVIDCRWNARDLAWYFDISDANASPIRSGIKILIGSNLGRDCVDPRYPVGAFMCVDLSGAQMDAGYDDLGARVVVYFYTALELRTPP